MGLIVKSLQVGEKSRNKFKVHKGYNVIRTNSSSLGVEVYKAEYQTGSLLEWNTGSADPTTTNGVYQNLVHHSINTMFYRNFTNNPDETLAVGGSLPQNQKRILDRKATVISIPQRRFGEKVYEGSFEIEGKDTVRVKDDKNGNLIDPDLSVTDMIPSSSELIRLSFNEAHEFVGEPQNDDARYRPEYQTRLSEKISPFANVDDGRRRVIKKPFISNFQLDDTSPKRQRIYAYNVNFDERDGSYGTHVQFPGIGGYQSQLNSVDIHSPQRGGAGGLIISERQDMQKHFKFLNGEDFAVAFWINIPPSQSVTQSFDGFEPTTLTNNPNTQIPASTTFEHDTNVIATRAGMTKWRRSPFKIEVFNQRKGDVDTSQGGDVGKLVIKRGQSYQCQHNSTPALTSSAQLNDGEWHHIVYQYQTGSNEIWVDGIKQVSASDTAVGTTNANNPLCLGGELRGYLTASATSTAAAPRIGANFEHKWHWTKQGGFGNSSPKNIVRPFSGSMDEFRIFNRALKYREIRFLSESNNTNQVGNIFYQHGFGIITSPNSKYRNVMDDLNAEIKFNGCTQFTELEYVLNVKSHEFDASENITLRKNEDPDEITMKDFASASTFSPYISTIGLYNNQLDLLAIAKLAQPMKKPRDTDLTFIVRMDKL